MCVHVVCGMSCVACGVRCVRCMRLAQCVLCAARCGVCSGGSSCSRTAPTQAAGAAPPPRTASLGGRPWLPTDTGTSSLGFFLKGPDCLPPPRPLQCCLCLGTAQSPALRAGPRPHSSKGGGGRPLPQSGGAWTVGSRGQSGRLHRGRPVLPRQREEEATFRQSSRWGRGGHPGARAASQDGLAGRRGGVGS